MVDIWYLLNYMLCFIMLKLTQLFGLLLLAQLASGSAFNLEILQPDVLEPMVFISGKLTDYYNSSVYEEHLVCTNGQLEIIEFEESPQDELIVFRYSGAQLTRPDIEIVVEPNQAPKPFIKDFNRIYKKFTLDAGCPALITKENYYNRVVVRLTVHEEEPKRKINSKYERKTEPVTYEFSFLLNCDLWDVHKHFEYGYIFISIICITIVVFVSLHPRICSLVINKRPMNFEINWKWFLLLMVLLLTILGFIYSKKVEQHSTDLKTYFGNRNLKEDRFQLANVFLKHLGLLSSLFYVFVCCSEVFYEYSFLLNSLPLGHIKIKGHQISKRSVLSAAISFTCYLFGLWCENWIYYNLLSFCIAIGAIKMFRFRSLRNGIYTMLIVLASIVIFAVWSYLKLPRAVNDYASELSSPLFVEVPDLVNNLYKKCSWISIYDMILPGAILAYLRDYDQNYHSGWKGVYTFTSIVSFSLSCVAWVVIEALIQYNIPFCIIIYPPFILTILALALYRNEFETIWYGYFHFSLDLSIMQMIQQYRSDPNPNQPQSHIFPKEFLQAIKFEESRWSDSESLQGSHRRALDDSEIQVWSKTLQKRDSYISSSKQMKNNTVFISQNIVPADKKDDSKQSSDKILSASDNRFADQIKKRFH